MDLLRKIVARPGFLGALLWLAAGVLPTAVLFSEFGAAEGFLFARGYGELFVFPLLGAWLFPLLLSGLPKLGGRKAWLKYTIPSFIMAFVITCVDVTGTNRALWEMRPDLLDRNQDLLKHYRAPPPKLPPYSSNEDSSLTQRRAKGVEDRNQFLSKLLQVIPLRDQDGNWAMDIHKNSVTWWFYILNMSLITFSQLMLLGASISFMRSHGLGSILRLAKSHDGPKAEIQQLNRVLGALGLCLMWFLFRCVHNHHTEKVYPSASLPGADIMWIFCWLICLLSWSACMLANFETVQKVLGALGGLSVGVASYFAAVFKGEELLEALGPQGSAQSFAVLMLAVCFVGYLVWLSLEDASSGESRKADYNLPEGR